MTRTTKKKLRSRPRLSLGLAAWYCCRPSNPSRDEVPRRCTVWTAGEIDATHLSWAEGVVVAVFMDLLTREYV